MLTPALQSRFCKPVVLCYTGHIKQSTISSPVWQCDSKGAYHHQAVHQQYYNIQNNKCRPNTLYIVQTNSGDSLCKMAYPTLRTPSNSCLRQIGYKERPEPKLSNLPQSSSGGFATETAIPILDFWVTADTVPVIFIRCDPWSLRLTDAYMGQIPSQNPKWPVSWNNVLRVIPIPKKS